MKVSKILLGLIIILSFKTSLSGQKQKCNNFQKSKYCYIPDSYDFKQYGRSRSALLKINQVYEYEAVLTAHKDFKIGVCAEPGYDPVKFRVIEKESGKVIYDNSTDDYNENIGFSVEDQPLTVTIEVTVLATKVKPTDIGDDRTCAGIQILYKRIGKEGYN
jgi:hypothetical protein